ncbi:MAG: R3H domain-containing nucleic acid-binding protein, partial [Patescibacteria group bacterium]
YRSLKDDSLRELAKKAARRARFYKQPVTLEAMTAYNRRIIHAELAAHPDIKTESTGEGLQRRVVIKFIE